MITYRSRGPSRPGCTLINLIFMFMIIVIFILPRWKENNKNGKNPGRMRVQTERNALKQMEDEQEIAEQTPKEQDYFAFMEEVIDNTDTSVWRIGQNMILTEISTKDLNKYKRLLATKGFAKWKRVAFPSKRFELKDHGKVIYKAGADTPVTYSIAGSMKSMPIPVILLDEKKKMLYCVLATEFTR